MATYSVALSKDERSRESIYHGKRLQGDRRWCAGLEITRVSPANANELKRCRQVSLVSQLKETRLLTRRALVRVGQIICILLDLSILLTL